MNRLALLTGVVLAVTISSADSLEKKRWTCAAENVAMAELLGTGRHIVTVLEGRQVCSFYVYVPEERAEEQSPAAVAYRTLVRLKKEAPPETIGAELEEQGVFDMFLDAIAETLLSNPEHKGDAADAVFFRVKDARKEVTQCLAEALLKKRDFGPVAEGVYCGLDDDGYLILASEIGEVSVSISLPI